MNALQRDLKSLVEIAEVQKAAIRETDETRQTFHLMPPVGWMNDPNGLCWYKGNYHVFYQYAPFNAEGGVKFWGHWTSPDLLNWKKQPVFLGPDQQWNIHGVYSGSALVEDDGMYVYYSGNVKLPETEDEKYDYIYSGREYNVGLAVSRDGIHADSNRQILSAWDYPKDVSCHVRDPKVWKDGSLYYMALGARSLDDKGEILIFQSEDKYDWHHINTITTPEPMGYMWECPDLFCLDGQWIVMVSPQGIPREKTHCQNIYSCGYFPLYGDYKGEYILGKYCELDFGFDYYAPQTFTAPDQRRIVLGWMGMPDAEYDNPETIVHGWNHCMSIPREMFWNGSAVQVQPIRELQKLRKNKRVVEISEYGLCDVDTPCELNLYNEGDELSVIIARGAEITWKNGIFALHFDDKTGAGRTTRVVEVPRLEKLQIYMDSSSLEIFINNGEAVMSSRIYTKKKRVIKIKGSIKMEVYSLQEMNFEW